MTILYSITNQLQINLDRMNEDDVLQHHCLHIATRLTNRLELYQIISYCMSEFPSKWSMEKNVHDRSFTFDELNQQGTTSEQLYRWSASMDMAENYQFYLDEMFISKTSSLPTIFYNCTSPYFGPVCQYTLDIPIVNNASLNMMIDGFYQQLYEPTVMTCYMHLKCHRIPTSACLDWTEICDGKIDCLNDGVDEEHCWQLQLNQCTENEYRCNDGQCIDKTFVNEAFEEFECIDQSDERYPLSYHNSIDATGPTFQYEDIRCTAHFHLTVRFTSSCVYRRNQLIFEAMFANDDDPCWIAFRCYFQIPDAFHPACDDLCQNETCQEMIRDSCPDLIYIAHVPILFNHIYLVYNKTVALESMTGMLPPSYICYDPRLCEGFSSNKTLVFLKNSTCRRPEDFPLEFAEFEYSWIDAYLQPLVQQLHKCNTVHYHPSFVCNSSIMYQCINSSKCIAHYQIGDGLIDCDYGDDEAENVINDICIKFRPRTLFQCTISKKCIHQRMMENGICECGCNDHDICEDEGIELAELHRHISFSTICDGISELLPRFIDGRNETDETECQFWQCDNTYTHCNGMWHCLDGADEIDCLGPSALNCPPKHHICISITTKQPICLPIDRAGDGKIDCLEAADEPQQCQMIEDAYTLENIDCQNYGSLPCIKCIRLCLDGPICNQESSERFCLKISSSIVYDSVCDDNEVIDPDLNRFGNTKLIAHKTTALSLSSLTQYEQRCHRGIPLRVWIDRTKNQTISTCLCPPSYYGASCQYQNERVSLSLKFQVHPDSLRTVFAIVVSLIDDSNERTVHSYEQFSSLYIRDCERKFNIYLLYSTRPKSPTKRYFVQIDIYEKVSLTYRASFLQPVKFPFLPVQRLAIHRTIPHANDNRPKCNDDLCVHGQCRRYVDDSDGATFCQCHQGWSGKYCHIPHTCNCAFTSICAGTAVGNRSICICPSDRFGARCSLRQTICQSNPNGTCHNGGTCVSADEYTPSNQQVFCICPRDFTGEKCEIPNAKIIISFQRDIPSFRSMIAHFVSTMKFYTPYIGRISQTMTIYQRTVTLYWNEQFVFALLQLSNNELYMIKNPYIYNHSAVIEVAINSSDRCKYIDEVLNATIANLHLIRRIKYYHVPCQSSSISCFYDDSYFCTCNYFGHRRQADCHEVNLAGKLDCSGSNYCENNAQCLQDKEICPTRSECVCPSCFYGTRCQFSSSLFGLSLDAILGYHIQPHVSLSQQPPIVKFSMALTMIITIIGLCNGILLLLTFKNKEPEDVGCDLYLLASSMVILFTMMMFVLKFWILVAAQMNYDLNRIFLNSQCIMLDFLLRVGLNLDQWLNACVAAERAITTVQGIQFNKERSKKIARYMIIILLVFIIGTTLHDPISRKLIYDGNDYEEKRIWCVVTYSSGLQIYNSTMNIFHFFAPFIIHLLCGSSIIRKITQHRNRVNPQQSYRQTLQIQVARHSRILIAPMIIIVLTTPRLILSFVSGCMKSIDDAWIFLFGYYISFLPPVFTFIVFVLPSKTYKKKFWKTARQCRILLQTRLHLNLGL